MDLKACKTSKALENQSKREKINLLNSSSFSSFPLPKRWGKTLTWIQIMTSFSSSSESSSGNDNNNNTKSNELRMWNSPIFFIRFYIVVSSEYSIHDAENSSTTWYFENHTSIFTFQIIIISHMTCFRIRYLSHRTSHRIHTKNFFFLLNSLNFLPKDSVCVPLNLLLPLRCVHLFFEASTMTDSGSIINITMTSVCICMMVSSHDQ